MKRTINANGFVNRTPKQTPVLLLIIALLIVLFLFRWFYNPYKKVSVIAPKRVKIEQTYDAWITPYEPTLAQCGSTKYIGYFGDMLKDGDCACSQYCYDRYVNYGDTVVVLSGPGKGKYCCKDKSGSKLNHIDIWKPVRYKGAFCYKSKIIVIREK